MRSAYLRLNAIALLLIAGVYTLLLALWVGPLNAFWSVDQGVKLIQVQSLLLSKFRTSALIYPGAGIDPERAFSPLRGQYLDYGGQTYAMFSQPFAALSAVPFFVSGYAGLYLLPALCGVLLAAVCAPIARRLLGSPVLTAIGIVFVGLATPVLFYSVVFWEHTPAALLVTLGVWLALRASERLQIREALLAGIAVGLALWLRNESMLAAPALALAIVIARGRIAWRLGGALLAGAALAALPLLLYNQLTYGVVVGPHVLVAGRAAYQATFDPAAWLAWAGLLLVPREHPVIIVGVVLLGLAAGAQVAFPKRLPGMTVGLFLLLIGGVGAYLLAIAPFGSHISLLETAPLVLLLALPVPRQAGQVHSTSCERERARRLVLAFALLLIGLAWISRIPDGGAQLGPRVLLPALPLLGLLGLQRAAAWYTSGDQATRIGALVVCVTLINAALMTELRGMQQLREINLNNHRLLTTVAQSGEQVIVTDVWFAPPRIAPLFYDGHLVFLVGTADELDRLLVRLEQTGTRSFYYLGIARDEILGGSRHAAQLQLIQQSEPLPHRLIGASYRMTSR